MATIPSGTSYPKMPFDIDPITKRTTNLVYPGAHAKQGVYVVFNNKADEDAYDGTGIPTSGLVSSQENALVKTGRTSGSPNPAGTTGGSGGGPGPSGGVK